MMPTNKAKTKPELQIGNYILDKTIGVGSFGKVKLGKHVVIGHYVAVKMLNRKRIRSLSMEAKIYREIQILKLLRHPHIIKLYEVIETPTDIFMIMEFVSGGELFDYIVKHGKLGENEARRLFQQIIASVEYCHMHMVAHRDLKPENLLLDARSRIKIADFGLSNVMRDGDLLKTSCGSPNYAAPEVISGQLYAGSEVDVWSCGVILYALLCAKLPFDDDSIPQLFKKIRDGVFAVPADLSAECQDIIRSMLVVDPLKRITIAEIRDHPWFKKDLPVYLEKPPPKITSHRIANINDEILDEIVKKFQVPRNDAVAELQRDQLSGEMNQYQIAYRIIEDHKGIYDASSYYYSPESSPISSAALLSTSPLMNLRNETPFDFNFDSIRRRLQFDREDSASSGTTPGGGGVGVGSPSGGGGGGGFGGPSGFSSPAGGGVGFGGGWAGSPAGFSAASPGMAGMGGPEGNFWGAPQTSHHPSGLGGAGSAAASAAAAAAASAAAAAAADQTNRQQWRLGLSSSRSPKQVMESLASILRANQLEWKVVGPYQLRCRTMAHMPKPVKIGIQLFKVQQHCYLVDLKKLEGELCPFFMLCSQILRDFNENEADENMGIFQ